MKWVADKLQKGESVTFKPRGHSMEPLIMDGQEVVITPMSESVLLSPGDVVLCKVKGRIYLHKILAVRTPPSPPSYLIANNKGRINGWTRTIYGYLKR